MKTAPVAEHVKTKAIAPVKILLAGMMKRIKNENSKNKNHD